MSLSLKKLGKNSVPIAGLYSGGNAESVIFFTDDDELNEDHKPLKKIRLNV